MRLLCQLGVDNLTLTNFVNHVSHAGHGGGVAAFGNANFTMEDGQIVDNTAKRNGGGIHIGYVNSTFTATSGSMTNNQPAWTRWWRHLDR